MGQLVANLDRIRAETGAHVLCIHHSGKDQGRGARGHSLLRAAIDTEIEVIADLAAALSVAHVRKQREMPTEGEFAFGLTVVEIAEGLTSCVLSPLAAPPPQAKGRKLTAKQCRRSTRSTI